MQKNYRENQSRHQYYETGLGMDMTERGESLNTPEWTPQSAPNYKPVYTTRDIWQAAALDCFGIPLIGVRLLETGRSEWTFDNAGDRAFQTGREFRTDGTMMVPVLDYRQSYRKMMRAADEARREGTWNNDDHNAA